MKRRWGDIPVGTFVYGVGDAVVIAFVCDIAPLLYDAQENICYKYGEDYGS